MTSEILPRFGETKTDWKRDGKVFPVEARGPLCQEDYHLGRNPLAESRGLEESTQVSRWLLSAGDTDQDPSGCLRLQIAPVPLCTMFFPIHTYS